ncbi:Lrp/AsnC family transcriptional regulator [Clostridium sp. WILCCON 0269]|uniref:Lrp/AsnC family transcriptional regulator n=1 Tax=Candidatus Clostridium eludens TaxID=3381663 RepID=A0ABW8SRW8_9CLOT
MDDIDKKILKALIGNGRESHESISRKLNLTRPAVRQRIKKLEGHGIIKRYQAIIDWDKLSQNIHVFIYLKINAVVFKDIIKKIKSININSAFLEECYRLAGEWCIMLKVRSTSPQNITDYIDELLKIDGVVGTSTTFILSSIE